MAVFSWISKSNLTVVGKFFGVLEVIFWWLVFILIGPTIALILGLLCCWKYLLVEAIAKLTISKTVRRMDSFDSVLAIDDYWGTPCATTGLLMTIDGKVNIQEFRRHFKETILDAVSAKDGRLIYQKLMKIPKEFCGYFFWEFYTDFKLDDHITEIDCSHTHTQHLIVESETEKKEQEKTFDSESYIQRLCSIQMKMAYPNQKPLWDITIFSNCSDDGSTAILMRFHHCIADGLTLLKLVNRLTGIKTVLNQTNASFAHLKTSEANFKTQIFSWIAWVHFIIRAPYVIAHFYLDNLFHTSTFTSKKSSHDFILSWTSVSLTHLRTIRQRAKVRFATLGMSLLSGALAKHLKGIQVEVEQNIRMMIPLPMPKHPVNKMANHWTMGISDASTSQDPIKRVKDTQTNFITMMNSGAPAWCRLVGPKLLALFPKSILKLILCSNHICNGVIFTSVPGSSDKNSIQLLGKHVTSMIPMIGPQYMQTGILCTIFTYDGKANIYVVGNVDILKTQENADKLCHQFIQEEVTSLLLASKEYLLSSCDGPTSALLAHEIV